MKWGGISALVLAIVLFCSMLSFLSFVPNNVKATEPGLIGVSGTHYTIDGTPFPSYYYLKGVDETTAWVYAIMAYCNGDSGYWGMNMNFPGPIGQIQCYSLDGLWSQYFWYMNYYGLNLVRFSSGDSWATDICYQAYINHPTQYYEILEEMMKQADIHSVYFELNMAGGCAGIAPNYFYQYGGTGQITDLSHTVGTAYHNYLDYITDTIAYCDGSTYTNAIFAYDVYNEPEGSPFWNHDQIAFRTWAREVANDTCPLTTHIVDMGVGCGGDLFGNFGFGFGGFYNCTGGTGFDITHRHAYGSAEWDHLLIDPMAWSVACNKPLFVGEVAKSYYSNGTWHTERWPWWESKYLYYSGKAYCNLLLFPTYGYPYQTSFNWVNEQKIQSVSLYYNSVLIKKYDISSKTVLFSGNQTINNIEVIDITGPNPPVSSNLVNISIYTPTGNFTYLTLPGSYSSTPLTIQGIICSYNTWIFNFTTSPYVFNTSGEYLIVVKSLTYSPNLQIVDTWLLSAYLYIPSKVVTIASYDIAKKVVVVCWLLIFFLPALILNRAIPKLGFIGGIVIMSIVLLIPLQMIWLFLVMMVGVVIIIFRGDDT
jgi:hypothetical protein